MYMWAILNTNIMQITNCRRSKINELNICFWPYFVLYLHLHTLAVTLWCWQ